MNRNTKISRLLLTYLLSLSLGLSACGEAKNDTNNNFDTITVDAHMTDVSCEIDNNSIEESQIEEEPLLDTKNDIDEISSTYLNLLDEKKFNYKHDELYIKQSDIDELIEKSKNREECSYVYDKNMISLLDKIEENSKNRDIKDCVSFFENEANREILRKILTEIEILGNNDINEDFHAISEYGIVINVKAQDTYTVAHVDEESKTIVINDFLIKWIMQIEDVEYNKVMYHYLFHDINHVRQLPCSCSENNYDISYANLGLMSFIFESSAESYFYNQLLNRTTRGLNYIYPDERQYENELLLLGMFNEDIANYYNAIYDCDLQKLYKFFDLDSEELLDFYKILYSIDAKERRNDFYKSFYDDYYNADKHTIEREVGYAYKTNLFKMFLKRLINYTSLHDDFTLEENLVLFNIAKCNIIENFYYFVDDGDKIKIVYDEEATKEIIEMENLYVEYLSSYYGKSVNYIREKEKLEVMLDIEAIKHNVFKNSNSLGRHSEIAELLLEKFPVIHGIIYTNRPYQKNYDNFINRLNLTK